MEEEKEGGMQTPVNGESLSTLMLQLLPAPPGRVCEYVCCECTSVPVSACACVRAREREQEGGRESE